jgi:hypothetical protein
MTSEGPTDERAALNSDRTSGRAARRRFRRAVFEALATGIRMKPETTFGLQGQAPYVPAAAFWLLRKAQGSFL